jgi:hypothetical protein
MKSVAWRQAGRSVAATDILPVVPCSRAVLEEDAYQSIRTVASQGLPHGGWLVRQGGQSLARWCWAFACMRLVALVW